MFLSACLAVVVLYLIYCIRVYVRNQILYGHIPAVGSANVFSSFVTAIRCLYESPVVFEQGYRRFKGRVFRVPQLTGWLLVVSGDKLVEELRKAPETVLSAEGAQDEILRSNYTMGPSICESRYHLGVMRSTLNRNLSKLLPELVDEIVTAFPEELGSTMSKEWTSLEVTDPLLRVVSRLTNRTFVGLPVCRIEEYCQATINFTINVMAGATLLNLFPDVLKPFVGQIVARLSGPRQTVFKYLGPIIEERKAAREEHGFDYPGKPNDVLSWLMDAAPAGYQSGTKELALRTLAMNFAAIHTTSLSLTHALYNLGSFPQFAEPLRQEIQTKLGPDSTQWTIEAIESCWKLDSFLKECQRVNPLGSLSMSRKVLQSHTFCDGTLVPAGAVITVPQLAVHHDSENYEHAGTFDAFRFWRVREKIRDESDGDEPHGADWSNRFTGTGPGYVVFGGGRHVCPGRFFASMELKCIVAYVLLNYDVKMRNEGERPPDVWFGPFSVPDPKAQVMFRLRA